MTFLLASVSNVAEARIALMGGADIIDIKDPRRGALGAASCSVQRRIVVEVAGARPVTAAAGELPFAPAGMASVLRGIAATGVQIVKVGVQAEQAPEVLDRLGALNLDGIPIVLVLFAEQAPSLDLLSKAARSGCVGVMMDTCDKSGPGLRGVVGMEWLKEFVDGAHELGLMAGLAGSLTRPDIAPLALLDPDILGFRGALCKSGVRHRPFCADAMARVRSVFSEAQRQRAESATAQIPALRAWGPLPQASEASSSGAGPDSFANKLMNC